MIIHWIDKEKLKEYQQKRKDLMKEIEGKGWLLYLYRILWEDRQYK